MASKNVELVLQVLSLSVTGIMGLVTFQLAKTTEDYKRQVDQFETTTKEYSIVTDLLQKCTSAQQDNRNFFLFLRQNQYRKGTFDLMAVSPAIESDKNFRIQFGLALNSCMEWAVKTVGAPGSESSESSTGKSAASTASGDSTHSESSGVPENWVYLGHYDGKWAQHYLDFPVDFDPRKLAVNHLPTAAPVAYAVRAETGALYLRYGTFGVNGEFPPVKKALAPGTHLEIRRTWPWLGDNDWWAVVDVK